MLMNNYLILRASNEAIPLWNMGSLPPMLGVLDSGVDGVNRDLVAIAG